jgi:hypothetical protein
METLDIFELTNELALKVIGEEFVNNSGHAIYCVARGEDFIGNVAWASDVDTWVIFIGEEVNITSWEIEQINYFMKDLMSKEKDAMN